MASKSYRFASFTLDLDRLSLHAPSGEVKLRPKSFEVLRYFVQNAQRVVTKEEVIATIWAGVTVTEESLTRCVSEIRRALGDEEQHVLKTVPKRGYLLDVPIEPGDKGPVIGDGTETPSESTTTVQVRVRPTGPEVRPLTILVCHIADLQSVAASLGPEELHKVIAHYDRCISEIIESHAGVITQKPVEGVHVCFGYPVAREDDAEKAVYAGLAVARAIGELRIDGLTQRLQVRVGIATGPVLVNGIGDNGRPSAHALVGETPLLAARLATLADPGTVVMSGATRRIVGKLFACRALAAAGGQGAPPVDASVVLYEDAVPSRFKALRGSDAPLIGRDEELAVLLRRWEQAKSGNGRVVLLTGEGGIGKSRIALALRDRLTEEAYLPLIYHCSPYHQNAALHPIITQFTRSARIRRHDSPEVKLDKLRATLAYSGEWSDEEVALFAALLSIPGGERYRLPELTPQQLKERTLAVQALQLRRLCAKHPVLIVYEDLHWIDPTSLEQLSAAVEEEVPRLPLLLIGTARPEFAPQWANHWHIATMPLARLGPPEVEAVIAGVTQGKALPREVVTEIVARTDGVPLFIEELTKSVLESGMVREVGERYELTGTQAPRTIPSTLYASLLARLDRLASVKDIAQIAAAIGVEFSYGVIAAVAELPEHDLKDGLAQLVAAELIFQRGTPPDANYRFKHTLVRDAAYASLVSGRRQRLHGRIARAIEEVQPGVAETMPGTLAHHHAEAGSADTAVRYLAKAGRQSLERSATTEAIAQLQKALGLLAGLSPTDERRRQQVDARLMVFQAYLTLGEIERMTDTLIAAVDIAKLLGDERRLAFATAQLALAKWLRGEHVAAAQSALFVLEYAERARKLDPARSAETLPLLIFGKYTLANALHGQGRLEEAIALDREIIDELARLGLEGKRLGWAGFPSVMARAFLSWFLIEYGDFDAAREQINRGCALADAAAQQPYAQVLIHAGDGLYHLRRGFPDLAVPILESTLKMCQRVASMEPLVAGWLGTALVQVGRSAEALALTEGSFRRGTHLGAGRYTWFYLFKAMGEAHAALGHAAEALAWADKAIQVTEEAQEVLHRAQGLKCRGDMRLALSLGTEAAIADIERARQIAVEHGLRPLAGECDLSLARAAAGAGRQDEAKQLASRAAEAFRALGLAHHLAETERLAI